MIFQNLINGLDRDCGIHKIGFQTQNRLPPRGTVASLSSYSLICKLRRGELGRWEYCMHVHGDSSHPFSVLHQTLIFHGARKMGKESAERMVTKRPLRGFFSSS